MAQPFDFRRLSLTSEPVQIAEQVRTSLGSPAAGSDFAISETGVLAYLRGGGGNTQLLWVDRSGKRLEGLVESFMDRTHGLSPRERRIAVPRHDLANNAGNIWIYDSRGTSTRFTLTSAHDFGPVWSPDGRRIVFS